MGVERGWGWREGGDRKRDSWHAIVLQLRGLDSAVQTPLEHV